MLKKSLILSAALIAATAFIASPSQAREIKRSTTVINDKGTASSTYARTSDTGNKSWDASRTTTGPDGKTMTMSREGQMGDNGMSASTTYTGPNGNTATTASDYTQRSFYGLKGRLRNRGDLNE